MTWASGGGEGNTFEKKGTVFLGTVFLRHSSRHRGGFSLPGELAFRARVERAQRGGTARDVNGGVGSDLLLPGAAGRAAQPAGGRAGQGHMLWQQPQVPLWPHRILFCRTVPPQKRPLAWQSPPMPSSVCQGAPWWLAPALFTCSCRVGGEQPAGAPRGSARPVPWAPRRACPQPTRARVHAGPAHAACAQWSRSHMLGGELCRGAVQCIAHRTGRRQASVGCAWHAKACKACKALSCPHQDVQRPAARLPLGRKPAHAALGGQVQLRPHLHSCARVPRPAIQGSGAALDPPPPKPAPVAGALPRQARHHTSCRHEFDIAGRKDFNSQA